MVKIQKENGKKTHHFKGGTTKFVILHDNLKIIQKVAGFLKKVEILENSRYKMYKGEYKNKVITLIATGMGAGNTALVVDQVVDQGAEYIIKIGTFGSIQEKFKIGDVLIPEGAVRAEGTTDAYAPIYYPAVPDQEFSTLLKEAATKIKYDKGIIWSVNVYQPVTKDSACHSKYLYDTWRPLDVAGVEMETSSLFVCGKVKGAKTAAILLCNRDWKINDAFRKGKKVEWDRHKKHKIMEEQYNLVIKAVLETFARIKNV